MCSARCKIIGNRNKVIYFSNLFFYIRSKKGRFRDTGQSNYPEMTARRRLNAAHPIEQVGEGLRKMMPWIKKIVDKSKN